MNLFVIHTLLSVIASSVVGAALWVYRVATNHLPHLQAGIDDLKTGQEKQTDVLHSIDKNMAVLAERVREAGE